MPTEKQRKTSQITYELWHALDLANRILQRDGIAALRGLAWTDDEAHAIRSAAAKALNYRIHTN
jgi:hypothetical protein